MSEYDGLDIEGTRLDEELVLKTSGCKRLKGSSPLPSAYLIQANDVVTDNFKLY